MGFFTGYNQNTRLKMMVLNVEKEILTLSKKEIISLFSGYVNLDSYEKLTSFQYSIEDVKNET
jgi:hypothetical protein